MIGTSVVYSRAGVVTILSVSMSSMKEKSSLSSQRRINHTISIRAEAAGKIRRKVLMTKAAGQKAEEASTITRRVELS